jgi:hypothetical protein
MAEDNGISVKFGADTRLYRRFCGSALRAIAKQRGAVDCHNATVPVVSTHATMRPREASILRLRHSGIGDSWRIHAPMSSTRHAWQSMV